MTRPRRKRRDRNTVRNTAGMVPTIPPDAITSTVPVLPVVQAAPPSLVTPLPPPVPVAVVDGSNHRAARLDGAGALPYSSVSSGVLPELSPSPSIPVADRAVLPDSQPSVIPIPPLLHYDFIPIPKPVYRIGVPPLLNGLLLIPANHAIVIASSIT